jgi:hypothetical protein
MEIDWNQIKHPASNRMISDMMADGSSVRYKKEF